MPRHAPAGTYVANNPASQAALALALGVAVTLTPGRGAYARDILRGGGSVKTSTASVQGANAANAASAEAAALATNAKDTLRRTTQALQAIQTLQRTARAAAVSGVNNLGADPNHAGRQLTDVPNGLGQNGLVAGAGWTGANLPSQSSAGGPTLVTVKQYQQQAILNWDSFNIGKTTTLYFDQRAGGDDVGDWIAFNKVTDPSGSPSQILGSIKAEGQVYIINQNGILFGGSSQVNVHALVASSLPINDNLVSRGVLDNPDLQFLFSSIAVPKLASGTMDAFTPPAAPNTDDGLPGDVVVQAGAQITSPTSADHVGGKVALLGTNVTNAGTISTPDGQTILAAGQQVAFVAHDSSDASLRGMDVYVGQGGGTAENSGVIEADRGNITMVGKSVNQLGALQSTTSVSLNGSIDLLARYNTIRTVISSKVSFSNTASGAVKLGEGSVTQILPETSSDERVAGTRLAFGSEVNIQGATVYLAPGAIIQAPSAAVTIQAGLWSLIDNNYSFAYSGGQIYLDAGAVIDVSGSQDVSVPLSENILKVQLLGSEFANYPTQRYGILRGSTVTVDARLGLSLADITGYIRLIKRSVGELTVDGGSVGLSAGNSVVLQTGSTIDVSGGWLNYEGGTVTTTRLIAGSHLYGISSASADIEYDAIYSGFTATHSRWGVTHTFTSSLLSGAHYESSYLAGGSGGSISITAPGMALDGSLKGNTVTGPRQLNSTTSLASALTLTFKQQVANKALFVSPTPPTITFHPAAVQLAADAFMLDASGNAAALREDRLAEVILSTSLVNSNGFGQLTIDNSDGNMIVPAGVSLNASAGGSITLLAANLDIQGHLSVPGGSLTLKTFDISPYTFAARVASNNASDKITPPADPTRGLLTLGRTASLSTAGLVVDNRVYSSTADTQSLSINGGAITLASYNTGLLKGSVIDASGGLGIAANGKRTYGSGGSISISAGTDLNFTSVQGGHLVLGSTLKAYGGLGTTGGKLTLSAPALWIGAASPVVSGVLQLSSAFFDEGGFASFTLKGTGLATNTFGEYLPGVVVESSTVLDPEPQSRIALVTPTTVDFVPILLAQGVRPTVSLTLSAPGVSDYFSGSILVRGDVVVQEGASILAGAKGSVTLSGNTVSVLGSVKAPGGSITVTGGANSSNLFSNPDDPLATVELGSHSVLSTVGAVLVVPDARGRQTGSVLDGGSIKVAGNIVAAAGAVLDVSGASGVLDVAASSSSLGADSNSSLKGAVYRSAEVESSGGSITLEGSQELFTDATLLGRAGGSTAQGGSLTISSGVFVAPDDGTVLTRLDATLAITQSGLTLPDWFYALGGSVIGRAVQTSSGTVLPGIGYFTADRFNSGGFASLTLPGTVSFKGPVTLTASRSIVVGIDGSKGGGGVIYANAPVRLNASYVALGTAYTAPVEADQQTTPFVLQNLPFYAPPTYGKGSLEVHATLVDVGNLSLQSIGSATLVAANGDIRGYGTLDIAGQITLQAGQIYPVTASTFTLAAFDYVVDGSTHAGSVTFLGSGSRTLPLSAGGTLNVYGSVIKQSGVLRAPLGTINIGWNGTGTAIVDSLSNKNFAATTLLTLAADSVTSVSAVDPSTGKGITIPYGLIKNGTSWIDPSGTNISSTGVPQKSIHLSSKNLDDESGSSIDLRGGGDLYAYQWISGNGGTVDILNTSTSFAVIPSYQAAYAPYASFNASPVADTLGGDTGYSSSTLKVGDRVYLAAGSGLPAGYYTLLPARYALLAGAYLVTPKNGVATAPITLADGATLVAGCRVNGLNSAQRGQTLATRFEVASSSVVGARAEYTDYSANSFFGAANSHWRLPKDSGSLVLEATESLTLRGRVAASSVAGGRGGLVDISSPVDILIASSNAAAQAGKLLLDATTLSTFGAESLLIGGIRETGATGVTVTVNTNHLSVDNAGSPLSGAEIILVANQTLSLDEDAQIERSGSLAQGAETLYLGNTSVAGSGNGLLVRVSGDASAAISRSGILSSSSPLLTVAAGVRLSGESLILDSSSGISLDPNAALVGSAVSLGSGQISLKLDAASVLPATSGLVLSGAALQTLESNVRSLSLLSYSSIDIYGAGVVGSRNADGSPVLESLSLQAGAIRGFQTANGTASFVAKTILLNNAGGASASSSTEPPSGTLSFDAEKLYLGTGTLKVSQYGKLALNASDWILSQGVGSLVASGALDLVTPVFTGASDATYTLSSGGRVKIQAPASGASTASSSGVGGLGASLTIQGTGIDVFSDITLPSGWLTLHATSGDLNIGGRLDVDGTEQTYFDVVKVTGGGQITLTADAGQVRINSGGTVSVSAPQAGGNAGTLSVNTPNGSFIVSGSLLGQAGYNGNGSAFALDAGTLPGGRMAGLDAALNQGGFTLSRTVRLRTGDLVVDGYAQSHTYDFSADAGSIFVTGAIDASGDTGGAIRLQAFRGLTLSAGSWLSVAAVDFDSAGKGGSVSLETRGDGGATLDLQAGSLIDLRVATATASSASAGDFTGTLHLRAPQNANSTDLQVNTMKSTIVGASSIVAEGFKVYTPAGGSIDSVKSSILANGNLFVGASGVASAGYAAMWSRLLGSAATELGSVFQIQPGAEIVNPNGDLSLGTLTSGSTSDWNLAAYRFGLKNVAGALTLRASGNVLLYNTLSDGFVSAAYNSILLAQNTLLPANAQSWSYRIVAGADFSAADFRRVLSLTSLGASTGSVQLGKNGGLNLSTSYGSNALTSTALNGKYQVIRTGSGDIDVIAGRDVQLLNAFASIFTVGTQVVDASLGGTFDVPILDASGGETTLGAAQQNPSYAAQYSYAGGNVNVTAQQDIIHLTKNTAGTLIADSQRELPINWLYRRGYVDPSTGLFGTAKYGDVASTTWWVDFSNFFEGAGALGGGNVTLTAGRDVSNVDAVAPTNARMAKGMPDASTLVELGGGDVTVRAGRDIDGGVYYVERGKGTLVAGNTIHTNSTRSPSLTTIKTPSAVLAAESWLPTTLFLGKGSFNVEARGDLLLGPVVNAFLLPEGYNNTFWYKTYFSTYAQDSAVNVTSLTGAVTLREGTTLGGVNSAVTPILQAWFQNVLLLTSNPASVSYYQPWLRLDESNVSVFSTLYSLMPSTLNVTAFSGDINIVGRVLLSPSSEGNLELIAGASINGLQPAGTATVSGTATKLWAAGSINISDADPDSIPGIEDPLAYQLYGGTAAGLARQTGATFLKSINSLFAESGSTSGSYALLSTRQALHKSGLLHLLDIEPVRLYASGGDISGVTVYSSKVSRILAGEDITDVALYLQNVKSSDVSVVAAGGDIVAYDPSSALRSLAQASGNALNYTSGALSGDIWIGGLGTLEVLAGDNLDLGIGTNGSDGTGLGIVSIGNTRNPYLPYAGADIVAGAGLGVASSLASSSLDVAAFVSAFLDPVTGGEQAARYLPSLGSLLDLSGASSGEIWEAFRQLSSEQQAKLVLDIFYLVLRDSGRDRSDPSSAGYRQNYPAGYAAIQALFPGNSWKGDISLTSREIKTKNGGNISLFAPGGKLTVGYDLSGNQALEQGILTESGGDISIFTKGDVIVGTSRIFTLRGGNEIIWSTQGDIAAGASSKTVQSAPPTRVIIDPQSGNVQTDLAGLATGGGIGVLTTVTGVEPGDVDLIAPEGTIDAGDAGIRVSGNLNVSALQVVNAANIQVGGNNVGAAAPVSVPANSNLSVNSNATAATTKSSESFADQQTRSASTQPQDAPSLITVEVLGYGGGEDDESAEPPTTSVTPPIPDTSSSAVDPDDDLKKKKKTDNIQ